MTTEKDFADTIETILVELVKNKSSNCDSDWNAAMDLAIQIVNQAVMTTSMTAKKDDSAEKVIYYR